MTEKHWYFIAFGVGAAAGFWYLGTSAGNGNATLNSIYAAGNLVSNPTQQ